jgi:hypothetical protein
VHNQTTCADPGQKREPATGRCKKGIDTPRPVTEERISFQWNRNSLSLSFSGRIFCSEPVSTSPENALVVRKCAPSADPQSPHIPLNQFESLLAVKGLRECVSHFRRDDPFWILEPELGRGAEPQGEAERAGDRFFGVFRWRISLEDGLRMQCGRHVDALDVVVGAVESDVLGGKIGADALARRRRRRTRLKWLD